MRAICLACTNPVTLFQKLHGKKYDHLTSSHTVHLTSPVCSVCPESPRVSHQLTNCLSPQQMSRTNSLTTNSKNSMAFTKEHRIDQENRQFKSDWTEQFCFILPSHSNSKPTCLICMQTISVIKSENLKRHFNTMHAASFNANYPAQSEKRKHKIASMLTSFIFIFFDECHE